MLDKSINYGALEGPPSLASVSPCVKGEWWTGLALRYHRAWVQSCGEEVGRGLTLVLPSPGPHLVVTNCSAEHSHPALSCKMAAELDAFLASGLR